MTFDDNNAQLNAFKYMTGQLDFFSFDPDEVAILYEDLSDSDIPDFKIASRKLNYFGEDYEYYMKYTRLQEVWVNTMCYVNVEYTFLVPAGYDGIVVYISNAANWSEETNRVISDNFDNDTLFFRLRTQTN
jgi:hypothetical protein